MIDKKIPVKMGHLMLDHPAGELVEGLRLFLKILVVVLDSHAVRPRDIAIDPGDAEATF